MGKLKELQLQQQVDRKNQHIDQLNGEIAKLHAQLEQVKHVANDHAQDAARWQYVRRQGHLAYRLLANSRDKDADIIVDRMRSINQDGLGYEFE